MNVATASSKSEVKAGLLVHLAILPRDLPDHGAFVMMSENIQPITNRLMGNRTHEQLGLSARHGLV